MDRGGLPERFFTPGSQSPSRQRNSGPVKLPLTVTRGARTPVQVNGGPRSINTSNSLPASNRGPGRGWSCPTRAGAKARALPAAAPRHAFERIGVLEGVECMADSRSVS